MGSIAHAEMLYRTNLVAMVSGGRKPKFADNTVMIYDDLLGKMVLEFTFPEQVLAVRMKKDKIVAVCKNQIHIFSFPNKSKKLFSVDTRDNPLGLCEVSPQRCGEREVMVFPGYKTGSIQMVDLSTTEQRVSSAPVSVNAHKNELVCLAINQQGTMVATASTKGTLIRIWDTARRIQLVELRRGADQARIYCINFSSSDEWLCCSSDKGTVHIFALQDYRLNKRSALASIGVPGAYAISQWSLSSFTVPQECACICAFVCQIKNKKISITDFTSHQIVWVCGQHKIEGVQLLHQPFFWGGWWSFKYKISIFWGDFDFFLMALHLDRIFPYLFLGDNIYP